VTGRVPDDRRHPAAIVVRIHEGRSLDTIAPLPSDSERSIGFVDVDRFGHPVSRQPCGEPISGVKQPDIAGFGGEQHQLTEGSSATFLLLSTTASTASSYTVTSAACRGPSRTAAEYRAHERAFGVELACNRRTARERIGFGRGPLLDCGGQLHRAGLEGGGFGFQGLEPSG